MSIFEAEFLFSILKVSYLVSPTGQSPNLNRSLSNFNNGQIALAFN
jgi:hypothetical protein